MTRREANKLPDGIYMVNGYGHREHKMIAEKVGKLWKLDFDWHELPDWVIHIDPNPIIHEIKFERLA